MSKKYDPITGKVVPVFFHYAIPSVIGMLAVGMLSAAAIAVVTTLGALLISYGGVAAIGGDVLTSCWIAALGAAAYVAWFGLGSAFSTHQVAASCAKCRSRG